MAITKIHPIKSTLNLAIDYITKSEKTDEKILVSSFNCHPSTAHIQFIKTREDNDTKGTVLARHLIQSFLPGEVDPIKAHEIGMELCKKILKEDYEFVLATHIDRGHIHNHIIFNNVNYKTGKCYQSNKKSYHKIRYQSDELCKENKLSVIDEYYEAYKRKYKTSGKSWYEYDQNKKGNSWKSKLQFDIDRMINKSKSWEEFLENMKSLDYEIKFGKHIAFRHKDKQRFTRSKTIGEDYTEEKIKERIDLAIKNKALSSKGYEVWARKHNIKTMADSIIKLREQGINSITQLDDLIKKSADDRQDLLDKIKKIETEMKSLSQDMENVNTINKYREIYKYHKKNPEDKQFADEYYSELSVYKIAAKEILESYKKLPNTKEILIKLDKLQEKKNTLMEEYSLNKEQFSDLVQYRKNYENYYGKEVERT
ncbi:relaxase/mobilization nuclease domain-containing protein [Peptoniphilus grossensis]|uniref:relaxase/mobilization nuclease domain-containing protein n=1 Tax=Peptoniphilus grossensis TaxID=1465756 RepID=UPI004069918F